MPSPESSARLYATAEEARAAVDDAAYAEGGQPDPHTWLGAICEEAECYCGVQMPLNDDGSPRLTFEEWIEYHDRVLLAALAADELSDVDRIAQAEGWNLDA